MATLAEAALIALRNAVALREGEEMLIIGNPEPDSDAICRALFEAAVELGGRPVRLMQRAKTTYDLAERLVLEAVAAEPDVVASISTYKVGKDPLGAQVGRVGRDGKKYIHVLDLALHGNRRTRGFWSPTCTTEMFTRTVPVDYVKMRGRAAELKRLLDAAQQARITSPAGTDITVELGGKVAQADDGDYTFPGKGGNLPAGEAFISPAQGTRGVVVFDGTIDLVPNPVLPDVPVRVDVEDCYVTRVAGDKTAEELKVVLERGERMAREQGLEPLNAWHIGELGFGLNPAARLVCNMLEDEKVEGTVHVAVGQDYDYQYNSLVHQDCVVLRPTVDLDGRRVLEDGRLLV